MSARQWHDAPPPESHAHRLSSKYHVAHRLGSHRSYMRPAAVVPLARATCFCLRNDIAFLRYPLNQARVMRTLVLWWVIYPACTCLYAKNCTRLRLLRPKSVLTWRFVCFYYHILPISLRYAQQAIRAIGRIKSTMSSAHSYGLAALGQEPTWLLEFSSDPGENGMMMQSHKPSST